MDIVVYCPLISISNKGCGLRMLIMNDNDRFLSLYGYSKCWIYGYLQLDAVT